MSYTFKRLNEVTLDEAVQAWNLGFAEYFVDMTMTVQRFVTRFVQDELSVELSFIAYKDEAPVGIVLNGIRSIAGRKVVWNGGTGVSLSHRGMGIGKVLIDEALRIYREANADVATLEAIRANERAIGLYRSRGYEVADDLYMMSCESPIPLLQGDEESGEYTIEHASPHALKPFEELMLWQSQWGNYRRDGEVLFVRSKDGSLAAYALYRRLFDAEGHVVGVFIGQCRLTAESRDKEKLLRVLLSRIVEPSLEGYKRSLLVYGSDTLLLHTLSELGFKQTASQVYMTRTMEQTPL